jgi:DNA-binding beta-propeller fold protein YncE
MIVGALSVFGFSTHPQVASAALSNPYRLVDNWAKLPGGRAWGDIGSVAVDSKGNVWVIDKCGSNNCIGSTADPVLEFDPSGNFLKSFGAGKLLTPHSIYLDKSDNVWVVDERAANEKELSAAPNAKGKAVDVIKFDRDGNVLLTLGTPDTVGDPPTAFFRPASVVVGPNGDIFVSDGYPGEHDTVARIVKFSRDGRFLKTWGTRGKSAGEFEFPHSLAMDTKGRLFVADRGNNRIQIFNSDGKFLEAWTQFGDPTAIFIDGKDRLYVADDEMVEPKMTSHHAGIWVGSAKDGMAQAFIPALPAEGKDHLGRSFAGAEGIAADAQGNIYIAESKARHLRKYVKVQ